MLGDATERPCIKPYAHFEGIAVIDENPYGFSGKNWYTPQNNFFRSISNFCIDLSEMPPEYGTGIHHQVSQATGLCNVHFEMRTDPSTQQRGILMENASGGCMSDLTFYGGRFGAWMGNQQFTVRNVRFSQCQTAICLHWNWAWTLMDVHIHDCHVGLEMVGMLPERQGVGSLILSDWYIAHTKHAVQLEREGTGRLILDHVRVSHVQSIVHGPYQSLLSPRDSNDLVKYWLKAPASLVTAPTALRRQETLDGPIYVGDMIPPERPACLVDEHGRWFGREKPSYATWSDVVNIQQYGVKGDGMSDDTVAMQSLLNENVGRVVFVPYGVYVLHDTLNIPIGTFLVGEAQPIFLGTGPAFQDVQNPRPVVRVGRPGDSGDLLLADLVFSTRGHTPGAIVMEWNVHERAQGSVAMFDAHIRIGGFCGSEQELAQCPKQASLTDLPRAAFLSLHLTKSASGYFQNVWVWTADHELDQGTPEQLNVLTDRGVLIESQGPVWMYGTASEHALLYQYSLHHAANVLLAMIQTESPYFQGHNFEPASKSVVSHPKYPDPDCAKRYARGPNVPDWTYDTVMEDRALGLHISHGTDIFVLGSGQYSFFDSYGQRSLADHACQRRLCVLERDLSNVWLMNLASVGAQVILSVDGADYVMERPHREGFCSTLSLCAISAEHIYVV